MSKRNVTYIKPDEPSFLRKIKEQAGYKEGPTVETKREDLGPVDDGDFEDRREEEPTVVVLRPGDLTADEAALVRDRLEKEIEEAPADLSKPIVFKAKSKSERLEESNTKEGQSKAASKRTSSSSKSDADAVRKPKKPKKIKVPLSFDEDEEEEGY